MSQSPEMVIILSDGIRGHLFQSRGIAGWLAKYTGAEIVEFQVPKISGFMKFYLLKLQGRRLPSMNKEELHCWFAKSGGHPLVEECQLHLQKNKVDSRRVLFISAGSGAAAFNVALSKYLGSKSCALMTPSFIGTDPFDFAVVPLHDKPKGEANVLSTLGAPNSIFPEKLCEASKELSSIYPPESHRRWALLIGGDDANYCISSIWMHKNISPIIRAAQEKNIDLYITTSRRTSAEAEQALIEVAGESPQVKMLLLASQDPMNPVPGMMGLCNRVFCTEDSVSMVSEAVTAGHRVILMRVEHRQGIKKVLQTCMKPFYSWGISRFNTLFDALKEKRCLVEYSAHCLDELDGDYQSSVTDFNEARRAALWIIERWKE
ncbi:MULTISPECIES: mitochondrial fission ELM1 family protein [Aminobacterium]|jgi:hypothetical protein|uniref:mitochondrial fission ELM1 family protein n=1 Tax=Aminobacterium TaxID=81466 RepID=UPI002579DC2A|nr:MULTISPECIES: ELM1/GtrOC1 family putative glycosyltransferase [unclassified Aminobacterium]